MKAKNFKKLLSIVLAVVMVVSMFAVSFPVMAEVTNDSDSCSYNWDFENTDNSDLAALKNEMFKNSTRITNFDDGALDGYFTTETVVDNSESTRGSLGIKTDQTATMHGVILNTPDGMQGKDFSLSGASVEGEFQSQWYPGVIFAKDDGGYYAYRLQYVEGRFVRSLWYLEDTGNGSFSVNPLFSDDCYALEGHSMWYNGTDDWGFITSYDLRSNSWVSNSNELGKTVGGDRQLGKYFKVHYNVTDSDGTITVSAQLEYIGGYNTQNLIINTGDTLSAEDLVIEKASIGSTPLRPEDKDSEDAATYASKLGIEHDFSGFKSVFGFVNNSNAVDNGGKKINFAQTQVYTVNANYEKISGCNHTPALREDTVVAATCTEKGYTGDYYCTKCGALVSNGSETPALGHKYVETERVPATIESDGYYVETCERCDDKQTYVLEQLEAFTVVFLDADGNEYDSQTVGYGLSATRPATDPEAPEGMTFVDWDTDFSYVTDDMEVNPVFEEIQNGDTVNYSWNFSDTYNGKAYTTIMNAHSKRIAQFAPVSAQDKYYRYNETIGAFEINTVMTAQSPNSLRAVVLNTPAMTNGTYFTLSGSSLISGTFNVWNPGVIFAKDDNGYYGFRFQFAQGKFLRKLSYFKKNSDGGYTVTSILADSQYENDFSRLPIVSVNDQEAGNLTSIDFGASNAFAGWNKDFKSGYEVTVNDGVINIHSWVEYIGETMHSGAQTLQQGTVISPRDITIDMNNPGETLVNTDPGVSLNDNGEELTFNDKIGGSTNYSRFKTCFGFYHDPGNWTFGTNERDDYWATQINNLAVEYTKVAECDHDPDYYCVDGYFYDCEEGGETGKTICGACGKVMQESTPLAPRGTHAWKFVSEDDAGKNYVCTVCGKEEYRPNCEHEFGEAVVVPPTCTDRGYTSSVCVKCKYEKRENYVDALGHDDDVVEVKPTCTEPGRITKTCKRCGRVDDRAVQALGHDLTEWEVVREPSKDQDGLKTRKCTRCDYTEEAAIPYYGDSNGDGVIDVNDAVLAAQAAVGSATIDDDLVAAVDVNGDGKITIVDALLIARFVAKVIDKLPVVK